MSTPAAETGTPTRLFIRLNRSESNQHLVVAGAFIVLAATGFMLYLPESVLEQVALRETVFGIRRWVHRIAGVVLILASLYHIFYVAFVPAGRRWLRDMWPRRKDATDLAQNLSYFLGRRQHPPEFDRFGYQAKVEYYALILTNALMAMSGVMLWTESMWSKFVLDIALVIHGMEAVLACLALMVWHLYRVHLRPREFPLDRTWRAPVLDEKTMQEEHAHHYRKIIADPELRRIYIVGEQTDPHEGSGT
jgi:formate dehydrogenase gamma subunit